MLSEQIRNLFLFNIWAWERVFASVHQLDDATYHAPRQLFEKTIHATLVHCLAAEYIWLKRVQGRSPKSLFCPQDFADAKEIQQRQAVIADDWQSYLAGLSEEDFDREVIYLNTRGEQFVVPLKDICQHVVNHAVEHRSQITPVLYYEGVPTKPLDFVLYCLEN